MLFKNPVRTSKRTPHFTITDINWLTLFKEIIGLFWESHEARNTAGKAQSYWLFECGTLRYHWTVNGSFNRLSSSRTEGSLAVTTKIVTKPRSVLGSSISYPRNLFPSVCYLPILSFCFKMPIYCMYLLSVIHAVSPTHCYPFLPRVEY
jgi:hypothetical protein